MAATAAITANYEIGHNLKSIQVRDPFFCSRPMFSRARNAMKLSFAFYVHSNYLKIQNGRHLGQNSRFETLITLIRKALHFSGRYKLTGQSITSLCYPYEYLLFKCSPF